MMRIESLLALTGWRRRGLAALLGVCATAALPPVYVLPLLIPAFAGLLLMVLHASTRRQAFSDGWWWGLGHFTSGLYWICISLWVEPRTFAWLTPIVLFGMPSVLAVYIGLVTLTLKSCELRIANCERRILAFALLWTGAEYLRAHLFTGFPWNLIGYAWTVSDVTIQLASVTGIYGLSWITVLAASLPALFYSGDRRAAKRCTFFVASLLAAMAIFGAVRLESHPTRYTHVKVRIVQGNVAQSLKWDQKAAVAGMQKQIRLSKASGIDSVNLVLWPETAVPFYVRSMTPLTQDLGSMLPTGALLITGGLRSNDYDRNVAWNSVFAIDSSGKVVAEYDKHHLVPFGEYIPLRSVLPVETFAPNIGDFSRGAGPRTLSIDPYPAFSPLVCYEAIFPGEATDGTGRAEWLLSLTDDAWFGISTGPYQDAQMARVRAVEQGLPLLRAANTGVTAAFDGYGRMLATLPLEKEGILTLYLPVSEHEEAVFTRFPFSCILFIFLASIVFLLFCPKKTHAFL